METKHCTQCNDPFTVTDEDLKFLDKYSIPAPTLCPQGRAQRRLAFRNERTLYQRKCDLTGKQIISTYRPDASYKVYDYKEWWSDKWDALEYGRDFDFSRPFFEQFAELQKVVPRLGMLGLNTENSEYTNYVSHLKNCYLIFSADFNHDCMYGVWIENSKNCVDNMLLDACQFAYESFNAQRVYNGIYNIDSASCNDCTFVYDCRNCSNCFMSFGLRNKQYCIGNQQYTREEYEAKMLEFDIGSYANFSRFKQEFFTKTQQSPHLFMHRNRRIENSTGDFLTDVDNCHECFEIIRSKDCKYIQGAFDLQDTMDGSYVAQGSMGYENCECVPMPFGSAFNLNSYTGSNLFYTDTCMNNCENLFGCISLRHKKYCILNKQYTKEEYEELVPKIIEHMRRNNEWGEFFPAKMSPFAYNETVGQEYYPITQEKAVVQGFNWRDEEPAGAYEGQIPEIPDHIHDVTPDITKSILKCEVTGKLYKITPQELQYYKDHNIPIPRRCADQRHKDRLTMRSSHYLWARQCIKCNAPLQTTYAPERPEPIYCEKCYLETVY